MPKRALVLVFLAGATACLTTIDESRIPCDTCDAGTGSDASVDARTDAPFTPGVRCGTSTCAGAMPVCCVQKLGDNDFRKGACDTSSDCQTGDYFECTRPSECGAGACCARFVSGAFVTAACALCGPSSQSVEHVALCDGPGAACPGGLTCTASARLPAIFECL